MKGLKNGQLLRDVENAGYDVFLTTDQGIPYQQNFAGRKMLVQGAILGAGAEVGLTVFSNDAVAVLQPGLEASVERHVDFPPGSYSRYPVQAQSHLKGQTDHAIRNDRRLGEPSGQWPLG